MFNLKLSWEFYWRSVGNALAINDLAMGLLKPVVFGFILTSVGCYMGLRTTGGTQGVGVSTTRSVVVALGDDPVLRLLHDQAPPPHLPGQWMAAAPTSTSGHRPEAWPRTRPHRW